MGIVTSNLRDYFSNEIIFSFANRVLTFDASDDNLSIELPEAYTISKGLDGTVTRNFTADFVPTITYKTTLASPNNNFLHRFWQTQRLAANGANSVGCLRVVDARNAGLQFTAPRSFIMKPGNLDFGREVKEVDWIFSADCYITTFDDYGQIFLAA